MDLMFFHIKWSCCSCQSGSFTHFKWQNEKRFYFKQVSEILSEYIYKVYAQTRVIKSANEQFIYNDHLRFHVFTAKRLFTSATVLGLWIFTDFKIPRRSTTVVNGSWSRQNSSGRIQYINKDTRFSSKCCITELLEKVQYFQIRFTQH